MTTFSSTGARCSLLLGGTVLASLFSGSAASAQDASAFSFSGSAALVTDYRFRGLSLSDKDAAIQGGFNVNHESGFYLSTGGHRSLSLTGPSWSLISMAVTQPPLAT